jgi:GNAT superfamily N-acetyltransferase
MIGILERGELITFAGVAVQTGLYLKRHLAIFDFVTDEKYRSQNYGKVMLEYLEDYAKTAMCESIVVYSSLKKEEAHHFYEKNGFVKEGIVLHRVY